ncbi:MAG: hypothetical protein ACKOX6_07875 [Bdellovibrio sp.]
MAMTSHLFFGYIPVMQKTSVLFSFIVSFLFSSFVWAGDIQAAFDSIKDSGANLEPDGAVCEQLEKVRLKALYPEDKYIVTGGLEYSLGGDTVGELDSVVLDRNTNKVVLLEEVKCWKDFSNALVKATGQRDRFLWNLAKSPRSVIFKSYDGRTYSVDQFQGDIPFKFISQAGGVSKGFDVELELNLRELGQLRMMVLKCQQNRQCAKPE